MKVFEGALGGTFFKKFPYFFIHLLFKKRDQVGICRAERARESIIIIIQTIIVPCQPKLSAIPVKIVFAATTPREAEAFSAPAIVAPLPHLLKREAM